MLRKWPGLGKFGGQQANKNEEVGRDASELTIRQQCLEPSDVKRPPKGLKAYDNQKFLIFYGQDIVHRKFRQLGASQNGLG